MNVGSLLNLINLLHPVNLINHPASLVNPLAILFKTSVTKRLLLCNSEPFP